MVDWDQVKEKTIKLESPIKKIIFDWSAKFPDWDFSCLFLDYPPEWSLILGIVHVNALGENRLAEDGVLITQIAGELSLTCKKRVKGNSIRYTLRLPYNKYEKE